MADLGPVDETALHHVPAKRALRGAQQEGDGKPCPEPAPDPPAQREPGGREDEDHPDRPAPDTVQIFQPEDRAEVVDRHPEIDPPELRRLAIEREGPLPTAAAFSGGQPAGDRLPRSPSRAPIR